tara:strand:- start:1157 stop:1744 length:588 start_codon:yes stop_codon:yes gene_type:complete
MTFQNNKYQVIKNALSCELADFIFNYFLIKKNAVNFLYQNKLHLPTVILGGWEDPQIPNTYSCYGDFAMETLMVKMLPVMKKQTGLNLIPTYSYARVYKKGDELKKHKDRPSCEISTTLNLGGDPWSIFVEGTEVSLEVGDMLVYSGCELEHWREPFEGDICGQVFLHYNHVDGPFSDKNKFDGRPMLGLPPIVK